MNNIREIDRIKEKELEAGIYGGINGSWHEKYKNFAWVYLGGLDFKLTEGDILCVMSQWGEIEDINLVRDKSTGKSMGFCFLKYEDQRSTILAVDNFNGVQLLGRTLRCDHVENYKLPKEIREKEELALEKNMDAKVTIGPGHAYQGKDIEGSHTIESGFNPWKQSRPLKSVSSDSESESDRKSKKKSKKHRKHKHHRSKSPSKWTLEEEEEEKLYQEYLRAKNEENPSPSIVSSPPSSSLAYSFGDAPSLSSWRGNRDPALSSSSLSSPALSSQSSLFGGKKPKDSEGPDGQAKRDAFEGFAGMTRRR